MNKQKKWGYTGLDMSVVKVWKVSRKHYQVLISSLVLSKKHYSLNFMKFTLNIAIIEFIF
jgi:hypothetical protein